MRRSYVQTPGPIGEYSALPLWQRAAPLDLVYVGYGLLVVVDHGSKHHSLYAHLTEARVTPGQRVAAGDVIGSVGTSGLEGPGLYFEIRSLGKPEDPLDWLRRGDGR